MAEPARVKADLLSGDTNPSLCVSVSAQGQKDMPFQTHTYTHSSVQSSIPQQLLPLPGKGNYLLSCLSAPSTVMSEKEQTQEKKKVGALLLMARWICQCLLSKHFFLGCKKLEPITENYNVLHCAHTPNACSHPHIVGCLPKN